MKKMGAALGALIVAATFNTVSAQAYAACLPFTINEWVTYEDAGLNEAMNGLLADPCLDPAVRTLIYDGPWYYEALNLVGQLYVVMYSARSDFSRQALFEEIGESWLEQKEHLKRSQDKLDTRIQYDRLTGSD